MQHINRPQALQSSEGTAAGRTADDGTGAHMCCILQCVVRYSTLQHVHDCHESLVLKKPAGHLGGL
jgi:hypothetical protein